MRRRFDARMLVRGLIAGTSGALSVLAFAPFGYWYASILGLAVLFWLWRDVRPGKAFFYGWCYGFGLLGFGIFWVRISLSDYSGAPLAFAITAAVSLAAAMALFHGLAGAFTIIIARRPNWARAAFAAPAAWVLTEWLRGWVLTGFPWLQTGYSQIDGLLGGFAPIGGVIGVTLLAALVAGMMVSAADKRSPRTVMLSLAIAVLICGWALRDHQWTRPGDKPVSVALLQGNVSQDEKWAPGSLLPTIDRYLDLTSRAEDADLIIWPEAAIPAVAHEIEDTVLEPLRDFAVAKDTTIVLGVLFEDRELGRYYTSVLALDKERDRYDKRHLVPFGEYFPLGFLWKDALRGLATLGEDFTPGNARTPALQAGDWNLGASVCYEILFGEEVRQALPEAVALVNVSNDGWFGDSLGPHQHLEIARMRALETGRFLIRATNTGITAVIAPNGRVIDRLPQFTKDILRSEFIPYTGMTPYGRWGQWPALILVALLVVGARFANRRVQ